MHRTPRQVNDQPSDNQLCQALGALTGLTHLEMVTIRWVRVDGEMSRQAVSFCNVQEMQRWGGIELFFPLRLVPPSLPGAILSPSLSL